jgi:hypothetical protein
MISQASERAMNYAEIAGTALGSQERDLGPPSSAVVDVQTDVQNRLACVQRILLRRQAEMSRLPAMRVQVRMMQRPPRTIVLPEQNIVIEVPQPPQAQVDTF